MSSTIMPMPPPTPIRPMAAPATVVVLERRFARRSPGPPTKDRDDTAQAEQDAVHAARVATPRPYVGTAPLVAALRAEHRASGRWRVLTNVEACALVALYQCYGDIDARNILVVSNQGMIRHIVRRKFGKHASDDMVQNGSLGIMRAVETFDPGKATMFSTYAALWIYSKAQRDEAADLKHTRPVIDAGLLSHRPAEERRHGSRERARRTVVRLDSPVEAAGGDSDGSGLTLVDMLADNSMPVDEQCAMAQRLVQVREVISIALARQAATERKTRASSGRIKPSQARLFEFILEHRLLQGDMTLAEVGDELGLSREGVRLAERRLLKLLAQQLDG